MTEADHRKIGIMADSHGDPGSIDAGARHLERHGCEVIYHLGDICDTNRWQTADQCVSQVKRHGIIAVRGNNDHSLAADARGRTAGRLKPATIVFLESLPLSLCVGGATLVHSQPFIEKLGLSAMVGMIGRREAELFFTENPEGMVFRGHGHQPEMIDRPEGKVRFGTLSVGATVDLDGRRPCIITCGAVVEGYAMVWHAGDDRLECCRFR